MIVFDERLFNEAKERLEVFVPDPHTLADKFLVIALEQAFEAASEGNFGIGAVLVADGEEVVEVGRNRVYVPSFRSDMHAEMDVLTRFERRTKGVYGDANYTLYSTLEPCPMCLARLVTTPIGDAFYAATDFHGGMASRFDALPPVWHRMRRNRRYEPANCSPELALIADQVFNAAR